jgi:hypothetical protein
LIASCSFWIEPDYRVGAELLQCSLGAMRVKVNVRTLVFRSIIAAILAFRMGRPTVACQIYGWYRKFCEDTGVSNLNPMDEAACEREIPIHLSEFERDVNYKIGEGLSRIEIEEMCKSLCEDALATRA